MEGRLAQRSNKHRAGRGAVGEIELNEGGAKGVLPMYIKREREMFILRGKGLNI